MAGREDDQWLELVAEQCASLGADWWMELVVACCETMSFLQPIAYPVGPGHCVIQGYGNSQLLRLGLQYRCQT